MKSCAGDWVEVLSKEEILGTLRQEWPPRRTLSLNPGRRVCDGGTCSADMNTIKTVSVCGLGKLGSCIAATLAARGFEVVGVDIDPEKVNRINDGLAPLDEPLLAETIRAGHSRLRATLDPRKTVDTDVTFFIPPSPKSAGREFFQRVLAESHAAGGQGHEGRRQTETPVCLQFNYYARRHRWGFDSDAGTRTRWHLRPGFQRLLQSRVHRLGDVVNGLLEPDLVLIGESDPESGAALEQLYEKYNRNSPRIARMSIISAELTKISLNSYITMKISFTNQLRLIAARHPKADIHAILDAIGSDSRIGKKYLRAGLSYGGPCFPRDNRLLAYAARQVGLEAPLAEASDRVNERTKQELVEKVQRNGRAGRHRCGSGRYVQAEHVYYRGSCGTFSGAAAQTARLPRSRP